jgi:hypothetical protein
MGRLLSFNKPEWPFFIPAILGALIDGSAMPVGRPLARVVDCGLASQ